MLNVAARIFVALASGVIFGCGLSLSGMLDPARVRRFLDIAGQFDPRASDTQMYPYPAAAK
jgi:uncharacterized protein